MTRKWQFCLYLSSFNADFSLLICKDSSDRKTLKKVRPIKVASMSMRYFQVAWCHLIPLREEQTNFEAVIHWYFSSIQTGSWSQWVDPWTNELKRTNSKEQLNHISGSLIEQLKYFLWITASGEYRGAGHLWIIFWFYIQSWSLWSVTV